jgi:hypothetical protein
MIKLGILLLLLGCCIIPTDAMAKRKEPIPVYIEKAPINRPKQGLTTAQKNAIVAAERIQVPKPQTGDGN